MPTTLANAHRQASSIEPARRAKSDLPAIRACSISLPDRASQKGEKRFGCYSSLLEKHGPLAKAFELARLAWLAARLPIEPARRVFLDLACSKSQPIEPARRVFLEKPADRPARKACPCRQNHLGRPRKAWPCRQNDLVSSIDLLEKQGPVDKTPWEASKSMALSTKRPGKHDRPVRKAWPCAAKRPGWLERPSSSDFSRPAWLDRPSSSDFSRPGWLDRLSSSDCSHPGWLDRPSSSDFSAPPNAPTHSLSTACLDRSATMLPASVAHGSFLWLPTLALGAQPRTGWLD
jgi:hypothetical protein